MLLLLSWLPVCWFEGMLLLLLFHYAFRGASHFSSRRHAFLFLYLFSCFSFLLMRYILICLLERFLFAMLPQAVDIEGAHMRVFASFFFLHEDDARHTSSRAAGVFFSSRSAGFSLRFRWRCLIGVTLSDTLHIFATVAYLHDDIRHFDAASLIFSRFRRHAFSMLIARLPAAPCAALFIVWRYFDFPRAAGKRGARLYADASAASRLAADFDAATADIFLPRYTPRRHDTSPSLLLRLYSDCRSFSYMPYYYIAYFFSVHYAFLSLISASLRFRFHAYVCC